MKLKDLAGYAVARLKEPSTYTGIAVLLGLAGYNVDPGMMQHIMAIGTAAAGGAAVMLADPANKATDPAQR